MIINIPRHNLAELYQLNPNYAGRKCGDIEYRLVTKYQDSAFLMRPDFQKISHSVHFRKCLIKFVFWKDLARINIMNNIVEIFSEILSFTYEIKFLDFSILKSNPNAGVHIDFLLNKSVHCTSSFCDFGAKFGVSVGSPYTISEFIVVFTPRNTFSLNNAIRQYWTADFWKYLYAFYLILSIMSYLVSQNRGLTNFIGTYLNIFGTFYGHPLRIPRNLKSLIISAFILGLVIRTAYQGLIYKSLTFDLYNQHPAHLINLQGGLWRVLFPNVGNSFDNVIKNLIQSGVSVTVSKSPIQELLDNLSQMPYDTGALVDQHNFYYNLERKLIDERIHVIRENVVSSRRCLFFQKNHPLENIFDHYMQILTESGFVSKWTAVRKDKIRFETIKEPAQIEVMDIWMAFVIAGVGLGISFLIFFIEIVYFSIFLSLFNKVRKRFSRF